MEWDESLSGAYLVVFARRMSCGAARLNYLRTRYTRRPPYRAVRKGYRCTELETRHEYSDVRCTKRGTSRVSFRWQTGA